MSKITVVVWGKAVVCEVNHECRWRHACTNHISAGEFRSDYGLRPNITGLDAVNGVAWCSTMDTISDDQLEFGEMVTTDEVSSQLSLEL